ncbi:MAG: hypothetical protein ACI398_08480 [Clostridium sp.]
MLKKNRWITIGTSIILIISLNSIDVYAAPADISTDEAVYANLDYYGNISDLSIVKGVSLNGIKEFTDYGEYKDVVNMSNYIKPEISDDSVTWNMNDLNTNERFYYECIPKSTDIEMPWSFDVNYKLNGVPQNAEDIAGKSGVVEISIKAIPNENIADYYKNNMILQVICIINMDDTLSIEAPGAQLQSAGTYKGIVFFGLPGEETTFDMRIGTESFESSGIEMTMIPGKSDQLEEIKNIRDVKDTVKDSLDSINKSLNSVFGIFGDMSDGLGKIKSGLNKLNESRETINNSTDEIYDNTDELIKKLDEINGEVNMIIPYFTTASQCVTDINMNTNDMINTVLEMRSQIAKYKTSLRNIKSYITKYQNMINKLSKLDDDNHEVLDDLRDELEELQDNADGMSSNINKVRKDIKEIKENVDDVEGKLKEVRDKVHNDTIKNTLQKAIDKCDKISDIVRKISNAAKDAENIADSAGDIAETLQKAIDVGEKYYDTINDQSSNTSELLKETKKITANMIDTLYTADEFIENTQSLNDTANTYYDDCLSVLQLTQDLNSSINSAVTDTSKLLGSIENLLRSNQEKLNFSAKDTLEGLIDIMDKGIDLTDDSDDLKDTNNTVKNMLDDEIDKIEDNSNLLNMDYEESLKSFTSDKNPEPQSVQIIMRTHEITIDDSEEADEDLEKEKEDEGVISRIINIFKKIWQAIYEE